MSSFVNLILLHIWQFNNYMHSDEAYMYVQGWMDERLVWDPEKFSGIQTIVVPPEKVWLPDFILENS